ncbi:Nitronate monooxygenase [Mycena venus]|uniref:Nitronate monooxygenase n=1 Tax=Mycena venus TaxID=2733690 RepID=A0A8H6X3Y5_9AGAR|nr:Nitronate monooxygenase [Mycena venus]
MGTDGVVLGTRLLFTPECEYSDAQKVLVQADLGATVRILTYDEVGRTNGWPPDFDGRAVSNQFDEGSLNGDDSCLIIWASVGVGLTSEIKGAVDLLRDIAGGNGFPFAARHRSIVLKMRTQMQTPVKFL